jgi:hypothetical protein
MMLKILQCSGTNAHGGLMGNSETSVEIDKSFN